jgi:hypothetical protein
MGMRRNNGKYLIQIAGFREEFEDRPARLQKRSATKRTAKFCFTNSCVMMHANKEISIKICFDMANVKRDTKMICILCRPIHITTKISNFPSTNEGDAK